MKSITKLMVVAMLLVAALVVAPVAAARDAKNVGTGETIYVGEENLNLTGLFEHTKLNEQGYLAHFSGTLSDRNLARAPIEVYNASDFLLLASEVGDSTGTWYAFSNLADITDNTVTQNGTVFIQKPTVNLRVLLGEGTTSVDGKSVTRDSSIRFRIDHNLAGLGGGDYGAMQVRVTLPSLDTVEKLGGEPLDIILTGQQNETGLISLDGLGLGAYTARAVWPSGSAKLEDSNAVTFEVASGAVGITSNKDKVVRNSNFAVTITGESEKYYWVNVTTSGANPPMIRPDQVGVDVKSSGREAIVKTTAGGTRIVGLNTSSETEAKSYTVEVKGPVDKNGIAIPSVSPKTDSVKVTVEKGAVTITSAGIGKYYIGEEITLSGTCTESGTVYLFMTGPNLNNNGVNLTEGQNLGDVENNVKGTFTNGGISVEADDTWSFDWNTAGLPLDAGSYTIYAAAEPQGRNNLSGVSYNAVSVSLRTGFISAKASSATVAKGDKLIISGDAQGNPDDVFIWIFGKNYYGDRNSLLVRPTSVESDDTFELELASGDTDDLAAGQYYVIVQHPMGAKATTTATFPDAAGSILWNPSSIGGEGINTVKLTGLQAPVAATALINALDSPNIPDTYVKLTFVVEEPQLFIDPISTKEAGSKFTITGTTNLAVGGSLVVDVTSAAFQPGEKTDTSAFSGVGGNAIIEKGDGMNKWSYEVDAVDFKPDQYIVTVESIEAGITATALFDMVEATEEPTTPVGEVTTPPAGETTTPPAAETTTEPAPTPGFGALVALAGLGAVAFLVLRRK